jgi:hypothetical protein
MQQPADAHNVAAAVGSPAASNAVAILLIITNNIIRYISYIYRVFLYIFISHLVRLLHCCCCCSGDRLNCHIYLMLLLLPYFGAAAPAAAAAVLRSCCPCCYRSSSAAVPARASTAAQSSNLRCVRYSSAAFSCITRANDPRPAYTGSSPNHHHLLLLLAASPRVVPTFCCCAMHWVPTHHCYCRQRAAADGCSPCLCGPTDMCWLHSCCLVLTPPPPPRVPLSVLPLSLSQPLSWLPELYVIGNGWDGGCTVIDGTRGGGGEEECCCCKLA